METQSVMTPVQTQENVSLKQFKLGVDELLEKRSYFISQVLPKLQEGQDYYIIKDRKSLAKGGSEKLASIYNLTATFKRDNESLDMLGNVKGLIAYICTLTRFGIVVGQGRGSDTIERNQNDPNKAIKMTQKRAYVDAVIRATGLSDIFTQDLEDMNPEQIHGPETQSEMNKYEQWGDDLVNETTPAIQYEEAPKREHEITEKQKDLLISLITEKVYDEDERDERLNILDSLDKFEASSMIKEYLES